MARYRIEVSKSVVKNLKKIPQIHSVRIESSIENLMNDPWPTGCRSVVGSAGEYRLRIGNYRIVYKVDDDCIWILKVAHRKDVYR